VRSAAAVSGSVQVSAPAFQAAVWKARSAVVLMRVATKSSRPHRRRKPQASQQATATIRVQ